MEITILSVILTIIFVVLGLIHLYWLFGGLWGTDSVLPTKDNYSPAPPILKFATLLVMLVLISFGLFYLKKAELLHIPAPYWLTTLAYWGIPTIFIIRAIGDFNYVGFFKKIKNTKFASADDKFFSPLCLGIGVIGFLVQLLSLD